MLARLFLQRFAQRNGRELDDSTRSHGHSREISLAGKRAGAVERSRERCDHEYRRMLFPEDLPPHLSEASTAVRTEEAELRQGKSLRDILKETEATSFARS